MATRTDTSTRDHYVPQFYLERFTDPGGRIKAYDRKFERSFSTTPSQVAAERDFYRLPETTGLPPRFLEDLLSQLEGRAATAMREASASGSVSPEGRKTLAVHIALQMLRTRHTRDVTEAMAEWSGSLLAQIAVNRRLEEGDFEREADRELAERALAGLIDGSVRVRPSEGGLLGFSLLPFERIVPLLLDGWMWVVVVLDRHGFLTTDNPVMMLGEPEPGSPATNVGPGTALEIWFPLDSRRALVLSRDTAITSPLIGLGDAHLRAINLRFALESSRWIFFRPGTDPLKGFQIRRESPQFQTKTIGRRNHRDGTTGELVRIGLERPHVPREQLLSGRFLAPFRHQ